ncbi:MAG: hypothetical protein NTZ10_06575 [Candidatus Saganbacteria bacterium]|nr:hypothetical protein [Candidatus Saganbacteria bacterium]
MDTIKENNRNTEKLKISDKTLIFSSYIFWLPSFYIILTEKRKNLCMAFHAAQALLLWTVNILLLIFLRMMIYSILSNITVPLLDKAVGSAAFLLWAYAGYCAVLFLTGKDFRIPVISVISDRIA